MSIRMWTGLKSLAVCAVVVVAAGCGGGGEPVPLPPIPIPPETSVPTPPALPLMVDSLGRQLPEAEFGGGDPAAAGADGVAFDNAPLGNAQVTLADNQGNVRTATTDASGYYRFSIKGLTPPFVVKVRRTDGTDGVSASAAAVQARAFVTINVTPLTDKLVGLVADAGGAAVVSVTPASLAANPAALTAARTRLREVLAAPITNAGLEPSTYDSVSTRFKASSPDAHAALLQALSITRNVQGRTSVVGTMAGGGPQIGSRALALDRAGNMYTVHSGRSVILKITPAGVITTVAGNGALGAADGPAAGASFNTPEALAVDAEGTIYVADTQNNLIRKITVNGAVSTLAGSGERKAADGTARSASFLAVVDFG